MKPTKTSKKLDYEQQKKLLAEFIKQFNDNSIHFQQEYTQYGNKKYMIEMQKVANLQSKVIEILIEDLERFFTKDVQAQMVKGFRYNTYRYIRMFEEIISEHMPKRNKQLNPQEEVQLRYSSFLKVQRQNNLHLINNVIKAENQKIPFRIHKNFDVSIIFGQNSKVPLKTINQIKAENIGELITTKAIVVRSNQVRPELIVGAYACDICNSENYFQVQDQNFKPLAECGSRKCKQAKMAGKLIFLPSHSKFESFQQMKIQETPQQLKRGAIPKATQIELRGSLVNSAQPGDIVKIQGIVLPKQRSKNKIVKDLYFDSYIYVTKIIRQKKKYVDLQITQDMKAEVMRIKENMDEDELIDNLAKSIAPQIYGMQYVKKALLLQMAGGVTVQAEDHLRIRGQINIALFGDPGIAKSQLLKHISYISPRAVYTTGKGSSGVGLTAAIVKDPSTNQLSLEAGALVLADMGVCCIDEFDKMQQSDRTAIHEVMEQQTVSITKAGIITTLNARTAVLAAANPLYGRYNKKQTTQKNLNLPAALLSRFDLIFVLLDQADEKRDLDLARHIGRVHQRKKAPVQSAYDENFLKTYIAMCKEYEPIIPPELHERMIQKYVQKRQLQMDASQEGQTYTTMRSLLGLIRLSQARAKLRFSNQVQQSDFLQSLIIIEESQKSIQIQEKQTSKFKTDNMSRLFQLLKDLCSYSEGKKIQKQKFKARASARGFLQQDIEWTLENYSNLGVISVNQQYIKLIQ